MKILTPFLLLILMVNLGLAQDILPGVQKTIKAENAVKNVYIPYTPDPYLVQSRSVDIVVNYIDGSCNWTPAATGAFDFAVGIMEQTLESDVPIVINATFDALGPGVLGSAGPTDVARNFSGTGPAYFDDTFYAIALANKLNGSDLSPGGVDINANFNCDFNWYFGTDGSAAADQYDFVTVVLHELCHGAGFLSSAREDSGNLFYGFAGDPFIYDRFIRDGGGTFLNTFPTETASTALTSYLTSGDLFWNTNSAEMYVPSPFEPGSSIGHFDDGVYDNTPNALMTHALGFAEAIHNPGQLGVDVLDDIGWEAILVTGIEDDLNIHGFDMNCWTSSYCPYSFYEMLGQPDTELNVGDTEYYAWNFIDEYPYNGSPSVSWKFEILHHGGRYLLDECTTSACNADGAPQTWSLTVPNLPTGYNWSRNMDNQVRGRISVSGSDFYGYFYEEEIEVAINFKPSDVDFQLTKKTCNSADLSFYASGASNYNVRYKASNDYFWILEQVPQGQLTHSVNGLNSSKNYQFKVEAYNSTGGNMSNVLTKKGCKIVIAGPSHTMGTYRIEAIDGESPITKVEIFKIDNPRIGKTIKGDDYSTEMSINTTDLPMGVYAAKIYFKDGEFVNKKFVKL